MAEIKNLYQRLLDITDEVGKIDKTGRNQQQGYAFIEQSRVVAELRPLLHKHGVMIVPETVSRSVERYDVTRSNGKPGVDIHVHVVSQYTLVNAENPEDRMVCQWDAGEAIDTSDKATNKAVTASDKTFLMKLFNISDQDDADSETIPAAPRAARTYSATPKAPAKDPEEDRLARAKLDINAGLEAIDLTLPVQKKAFITRVINQSTIETIEQAHEVMDAIDIERDDRSADIDQQKADMIGADKYES